MLSRFPRAATQITRRLPCTALAVSVRRASSLTATSRQQRQRQESQDGSAWRGGALAALAAAGAAAMFLRQGEMEEAKKEKVNWDEVRKAIAETLDDPKHDDGSWGPIYVRLAWHASGTYDKNTKTGGSNGATMRFEPESNWGANAGLGLARARLETVKQKFPTISYADLWTLAGVVAIEEMGGPKIAWRCGRKDKDDGKQCPPDGTLPDATKGAQHLRDIFYRMGFNDQEIVALSGAHALGRCHTDRSGFTGPWTRAPTTFSNEYFRLIVEEKWTQKKWNGPLQYEDKTGELMMLPTDLALNEDPSFKQYVALYHKNEEQFFKDFASAFSKLLELGVDFACCHAKAATPVAAAAPAAVAPAKSWWSSIFGGK